MIIDSSAILAILLKEPEEDLFVQALASQTICLISAATLVEVSIVLTSRNPQMVEQLDLLLQTSGIQIRPVTYEHALLARDCFAKFGKGRNKAGLNFGDCFSYALAKATGYPLLFKGNDFALTDITPALRA